MAGLYGQTDALAIAVVERINTCSTLSMQVSAQLRYRLLDPLVNIPGIESPVNVFIAPGSERSVRQGISTAFESTYTLHIAIQQLITGADNEETQCAALMRLRSEIVDDLRQRMFSLTDAVHPVNNVFVVQAETAAEANRTSLTYNLARLLNDHVFESDTIVTFKASA